MCREAQIFMDIKSVTEYDPVTGKVSHAMKPHYDGDAGIYTGYEYDFLQRPTKQTLFDGENNLTTTYAYTANKTSITTPNGITQTSTVNALGEVTERNDAGGKITYTYNALGKPVSITTNNSTTTIEYDAAGRQKKLIDPNAGTIEYEYYADGQLKTQSNANGDITEFTYDAAGRILTKTINNNTLTEYAYVESGNGIGQIQEITLKENNAIVHAQTVTYNNKHLPATVTDTYDGQNFIFSYTYDALGRPLTVTSPSGLVTTNEYNSYGDLIKIWKGSTVVWEGTAQNSNGQFTQFKLGNGAATNNTYNSRGELTGIQTNRNGAIIQNNRYEYHAKTGNLLARKDLKNNRHESFQYDNLDRLTQAHLNNELLYAMTYAPNGNISEKTDVGTYLYDTPRPHAISGIEDGTEGEGISDEKQFIDYTPFHKISRVAQGVGLDSITVEYKIYYGADQQRIKTEYYKNDSLKLTRYYFGSYELDIDSLGNEIHVDYVASPSGLAAIIKNGETFFVHTDLLGSVQVITNDIGTIVNEYAYSPWGERIRIDSTGFADITDRGYTMHEHLTALNLINMNGRVYDPVLARFLSPDPYVQAPDFTQSFNRYAYCWNNPFKYVDPSGEFFYISLSIGCSKDGGWSFSIGAGIGFKGGLSVGISIGYNTGGNSWSFNADATYGGAYVSAGYDTKAGWNVGVGYCIGAQVGIFNFSVFSAGVSYSQGGGFSANAGWINYNQYAGFSGNPSFGVGYTARTGDYGYHDVSAQTDAEVGDPIPYNKKTANKYVENFMALNDLDGSGVTNLYADGTLPSGYYYGEDGWVYNSKGRAVDGLAHNRGKEYLFWGKQRTDMYIFSSAFSSPENLYLTIGHELVHIDLYRRCNLGNSDVDRGYNEATAYHWSERQAREWGLYTWASQFGKMINNIGDGGGNGIYPQYVGGRQRGYPTLIPIRKARPVW